MESTVVGTRAHWQQCPTLQVSFISALTEQLGMGDFSVPLCGVRMTF